MTEMTVCMETAMADGLEFRIEGASLSKGIGRQAISAPAPGLLAEPASILPVWTAAGPWIAGVARGVPPALLRSVLSISRSELDFKLIELVPLSVGTLPLRYREQLLEALAGGNRLGPVHGRHYPIVAKNVPGGIKPVRDRVAPLRPSGVVLLGSFVRSSTAWNVSR
ncbi:MAG: hypothetical protein E6H56_11680 [Betaproteobacteria bacterium]|nr:MAG: hypothetical protein E6H56_11680 [Betaproteobacteria bacterium]